MPALNTTVKRGVNTACLVGRWFRPTLPAMHETAIRLYEAARAIAKLTAPSKVAIDLGESQQTLKHWENRGVSKAGQIKICTKWNLSPRWLAFGEGPMLAGSEFPVSHGVSHQSFDHPLLTREQMMTMGELPARFTFVLDDDAMGEHGRAGTEVLFLATGAAKVGAGVLVRDKDGGLHVRRKAQGRSDAHWLAVAPNRMFRDLDSQADGLQILAVWRGVVNKGLEDL